MSNNSENTTTDLLGKQGYMITSRKYRPQSFEEVVGQEIIKKELKSGLEKRQIANAYLFSGPRGVGKTSMARIFSKALNCINGPTGTPCNKCDFCIGITRSSDMDVIEIDGASYTKVENIRDLQEGVNRAPYAARYKVYIIDEVHMLSNSAFNALLKTLEEPPRHVVFIFATTNPEKIPETVISRCRHYEFKRIETEDIMRRLDFIISKESKLDISHEEKRKILEAIASSAEGGMRDAQVTLDQLLTLSEGSVKLEDVEQLLGLVDTEMFYKIIYSIIKKDTKFLILMVNDIVQRGKDIERLVKMFIKFIRDLMILRAHGDEKLVSIYGENLNRAKGLSRELSYPFLLNLLNQFFILDEKIKSTNLPARFLLEFTLIKMTAIEPAIDIDHILKELNAFPDSGSIDIGSVASYTPSADVKYMAIADESNPFAPDESESLVEQMESVQPEPEEHHHVSESQSKISKPEKLQKNIEPAIIPQAARVEQAQTEKPQEPQAPQLSPAPPSESEKEKAPIRKPSEKVADPGDLWKKTIKEISVHNTLLFSVIQKTKALAYSNGIMTIAVNNATPYQKKAFDKPANLTEIKDTLSKVAGRPISPKIVYTQEEESGAADPTSSEIKKDEPEPAHDLKPVIQAGQPESREPEAGTQPAFKSAPPRAARKSQPALDPSIMERLERDFKDAPETYEEAVISNPEFKQKVDLVVEIFNGKLTHFNDRKI